MFGGRRALTSTVNSRVYVFRIEEDRHAFQKNFDIWKRKECVKKNSFFFHVRADDVARKTCVSEHCSQHRQGL